jgi:hypothetical protein
MACNSPAGPASRSSSVASENGAARRH